jgi:hypothetical protein
MAKLVGTLTAAVAMVVPLGRQAMRVMRGQDILFKHGMDSTNTRTRCQGWPFALLQREPGLQRPAVERTIG